MVSYTEILARKTFFGSFEEQEEVSTEYWHYHIKLNECRHSRDIFSLISITQLIHILALLFFFFFDDILLLSGAHKQEFYKAFVLFCFCLYLSNPQFSTFFGEYFMFIC